MPARLQTRVIAERQHGTTWQCAVETAAQDAARLKGAVSLSIRAYVPMGQLSPDDLASTVREIVRGLTCVEGPIAGLTLTLYPTSRTYVEHADIVASKA